MVRTVAMLNRRYRKKNKTYKKKIKIIKCQKNLLIHEINKYWPSMMTVNIYKIVFT